jgi:hypothetical protein
MAIPLTAGGALDFSGWTPSGFITTVDDVNNNEVTFDDSIPSDVMVVIEYQTPDGTPYFDIYLGDGSADTFLLTVTQVFINEGFDDYLALAEYVSIGGGLVTLDFGTLDPEPIDSGSFPLQNVDVSIEYNTRSRSHIVDDFPNVDIEQSGTQFDLTRVNPGQDEERLFEIDISYLPTSSLDLNFRYSFSETENEGEIATTNSWDATVSYLFTERLSSTSDVSYNKDEIELKFNPDIDDPAVAIQKIPPTEEWNYTTKLEYSRPLGWADLDTSYEYDFNTREEEDVAKSDSTTHTVDVNLTAGRTKGSTSIAYDKTEDEDLVSGESTWATTFGFDVSIENKRPLGPLAVTTKLEYEYGHDEAKDEEDFTKNSYSISEDIDYLNIALGASAGYQDEESGDTWGKQLDLEADVSYAPFDWLDISSGASWAKTKTEQDESTATDAFIEGDAGFDLGHSATLSFGARRSWRWDDPGEDEKSFEFDASLSYTYAEIQATLDFDYSTTKFNGESEDTEDYGFAISVARDF